MPCKIKRRKKKLQPTSHFRSHSVQFRGATKRKYTHPSPYPYTRHGYKRCRKLNGKKYAVQTLKRHTTNLFENVETYVFNFILKNYTVQFSGYIYFFHSHSFVSCRSFVRLTFAYLRLFLAFV